MFGGAGPSSDANRGAVQTQRLGRRTSQGWRSVDPLRVTDPAIRLDIQPHFAKFPIPSAYATSLVTRIGSLGAPNTTQYPAVTTQQSVYRLNADGPVDWLSQSTLTPQPLTGNSVMPLGASPDLKTVYFGNQAPLTNLDGDTSRTSPWGLYESRNGAVRPAAQLPSGQVDPGGAVAAGTGKDPARLNSYLPLSFRNQVSEDGSRLFFVSPVPAVAGAPSSLYVRINGSQTKLLSHDAAGDPVPSLQSIRGDFNALTVPDGYAIATPDGKWAVFQTTSALDGAPDDGAVKSYRINVDDGAITYLAGVTGALLQLSDDGSRVVYMTSDGAGLGEVLVWDQAAPAAPKSLGTSTATVPITTVRPIDGGRGFVFQARGTFDPSIAADVADTQQVYRWVVGDAAPTCLSCRRDGGAPGPNGAHVSQWANLPTETLLKTNTVDGTQVGVLGSRGTSKDGKRVFFDTADPLLPSDQNGVRDVYLWQQGVGLQLVSSGAVTASPSFFLDNSDSGDDVFFATRDGLVGADKNEAYDVYDARVGIGFPPGDDTSCSGDACQGPPALPPTVVLPGTDVTVPVTQGAKIEPAKSTPAFGVRRSRLTSTRIVLGVTTSGAGRIKASGAGTRTAVRSVKRATTYTVNLRLTSRARLALRKQGRLKVLATVRFSPSGGRAVSKTLSIIIKRATR